MLILNRRYETLEQKAERDITYCPKFLISNQTRANALVFSLKQTDKNYAKPYQSYFELFLTRVFHQVYHSAQ